MADGPLTTPGVHFTPPPAEMRRPIQESIASALSTLDDGKTGALVAVANEEGANAVIVARFGGYWAIQAWVGKTWKGDGASYGASVKASW